MRARRVVACGPAPPGLRPWNLAGMVAGRLTGGEAPRELLDVDRPLRAWPAVVDGLQHGVGVRAVVVGPVGDASPEGALADGRGNQVGCIEEDRCRTAGDVVRDVELVVAGVPLGRHLDVRR